MTDKPDKPPSLRERIDQVGLRLVGRMPRAARMRLTGELPITIDGRTLDPDVQLVRAVRLRRGGPALCEPDVATARARYRRENVVYRGRVTRVGEVRDLAVRGAEGRLPARLYLPKREPGEAALLVYFHGGGFVLGDLETHDETCRLLCRSARVRVLSVAYRLAPEHPFPAGLEDARAAYRWARERATSFDVVPLRVAVGGDSAGGNFAAVIAQLERGAEPLAQLLIYPSTDSTKMRPSRDLLGNGGFFLTRHDEEAFIHYYLDGTGVPRDDPRVSPLLAPDLHGLAPALVVTAGFDLLRDEGEAYAEALRTVGNTVVVHREPTLPHGFLHMTGVSAAARQAVENTGKKFRELLDRVGHSVDDRAGPSVDG